MFGNKCVGSYLSTEAHPTILLGVSCAATWKMVPSTCAPVHTPTLSTCTQSTSNQYHSPLTGWYGYNISIVEWPCSIHCSSCYFEYVHFVRCQVHSSVPQASCCVHHCTVAALLSVLHCIAHYLTILLPLGRRGPCHCEGVGGGGVYVHSLGRCCGL